MKGKHNNKRILICNHHGKSGGNIVLHQLCAMLREKGIDARIFPTISYTQKNRPMCLWWKEWLWFIINLYWYKFKKIFIKQPITKYIGDDEDFFYNPVDGVRFQICPFFNKENTIVLYNEGFWGNFLKAKYVIRWLLSDRYEENRQKFGKDDLVIAYRQIFNDYNVNPTCKMVNITHFNSALYRQTNFGPRTGNCYIVRKGKGRGDLPKVFDGPVIDGKSESEIVEIFNSSKYCYSYDTQTMYSSIASVCGCISIVVPEEGKSREDYLSSGEHGYGMAYGDSAEELLYAEKTREKLIESLDYTERNEYNIQKFLEYIKIFD